MIRTKVVWDTSKIAGSQSIQLFEKIQLMIDEGETNGNREDLVEDKFLTVYRNWNNLNAAQRWIEFVTEFNPITTEIIIDESS
jgi:hypothetical protein